MKNLAITDRVTPTKTLTVSKYLKDIKRIPLLTPEEETTLSKRIKKGDEEALSELTKANLRFVVYVAKQYQHKGIELIDLINEGNIGLMVAAQKFDNTKGFKFITYAVWWIRYYIQKAISEKTRIIRLPSNKVNLFNQIIKTKNEYIQEHEHEPTSQQLSKILNVSESLILDVMENHIFHKSLNSLAFDEGDNTCMIDLIESEHSSKIDENMIKEGLILEIKKLCKILSPKESRVLFKFFGIERECSKTLEELGIEFEITKTSVCQIKDRAIFKLSKHPDIHKLRVYLG